MNHKELYDFLEAFVVMHSMDKWECSLVAHPKSGLYQLKLPKLLMVEIYTFPNKTASFKFVLHGGRGSYSVLESFEQGLMDQNLPWTRKGSHQYEIPDVTYDEMIDIVSVHLSRLLS